MLAPEIHALEKQREHSAGVLADVIARRERPSQLLVAARDAAKQAAAATAMARVSTSADAREEWLAIADAYATVAATLARLAG